MDMRVRPARREDRGQLLDLWERSVRATHDFLQESDISTLKPVVAEELASESVEWWVLASAAGTPVGFLGFANDAIEALFIDPDYRGNGAGKLLVRHASSLSHKPLTVDVNEQNLAALGFYQAVGFRIVGRSSTDDAGRPFPILHMKRVI